MGGGGMLISSLVCKLHNKGQSELFLGHSRPPSGTAGRQVDVGVYNSLQPTK